MNLCLQGRLKYEGTSDLVRFMCAENTNANLEYTFLIYLLVVLRGGRKVTKSLGRYRLYRIVRRTFEV